MDTDLAILFAIAAIWLAAGLVTEGLPKLRTARALRRRTGLLLVLLGLGLAAMTAVGVYGSGDGGAGRVLTGLALPTAPAVIVAALTVRRVRRLWVAAGAFAAAPDIPASPTLRAAAAHPMLALPVQVTGLVTLPATVTAIGLAPLTGPNMIGSVLTGAVLAICVIGVRHALRHSRLVERTVTVRTSSPRSAGVLHV